MPKTVHAVPKTVHAVPKTVHDVLQTVHAVPKTVHAVLKTVHAVQGLTKFSQLVSPAHKHATAAAATAMAEDLQPVLVANSVSWILCMAMLCM